MLLAATLTAGAQSRKVLRAERERLIRQGDSIAVMLDYLSERDSVITKDMNDLVGLTSKLLQIVSGQQTEIRILQNEVLMLQHPIRNNGDTLYLPTKPRK